MRSFDTISKFLRKLICKQQISLEKIFSLQFLYENFKHV